MSQQVKMTRFREEKMRQALQRLADERSVEGSYGIIDFNYDELLQYTGDEIRNKSYLSIFLNNLEEQGKISRIRRGTSNSSSRYDVKNFVQSHTTTEVPDVAIAVVKEPEAIVKEPEAVVVKEPKPAKAEVKVEVREIKSVVDNTETINAIKDAISEMSEYLRELPDQMIAHLNELSSDLDLSNSEPSDELKTELDKIKSQVRDLNKKLEQSNAERTSLSFDLTMKSAELEQRREIPINKDAVIRHKHSIMDEVERFLSAEDWKRRNMTEHFRVAVIQKLESIMTEVGVGES